MGMSKMGDEVW